MFCVLRFVRDLNLNVKFLTLLLQLTEPSTFTPLYWALTMQGKPDICNLPKKLSFEFCWFLFSAKFKAFLNTFYMTALLCRSFWVATTVAMGDIDFCWKSCVFYMSPTSSSFCVIEIHPFDSSIPGLCLKVCCEALTLLEILVNARPTLSWSFSPK